MSFKSKRKSVVQAFESGLITVRLDKIAPLYVVPPQTKKTVKYQRISSSIREIGLVEPLVVNRPSAGGDHYILLDGHMRHAVLQDQGVVETKCIVSTDDEAFTYNRRISRLATIQEHKMILRALDKGVPEERLAKALNINIATLKEKTRLLDGISSEVAELLKDKQVAVTGFRLLRKMKPIRQFEAAQLMVAMNNFTVNYVKSILVATPDDQLKDQAKPKRKLGVSKEQLELMEREASNLDKQVRLVEDTFGSDHMDLVLARSFVARLVRNEEVSKYLAAKHNGLFVELSKIAERSSFTH